MNKENSWYFCMAFSVHWKGGIRVIHWHWPRAGIVTCERAAEITRDSPLPHQNNRQGKYRKGLV